MKNTKRVITLLVTIFSVVVVILAGTMFTACPPATTEEETTTTTLPPIQFEIISKADLGASLWSEKSGSWGNPDKIDGKFIIVPGTTDPTSDGSPFYAYPGFGYGNFNFSATSDVTTTPKEIKSSESGKPDAGAVFVVKTGNKAKLILKVKDALWDAVEDKNGATGLNETILDSGKGYNVYVCGEFGSLFGGDPVVADFWGQPLTKMTPPSK